MVIEIDKKTIIKGLVVFAVIAASVCGGYFWGHNKGYDQGKAETSAWYETIIAAKENPKGNGDHFYAEEMSEGRNSYGYPIRQYFVYHSTPNCKAIENGVVKDRGYTNAKYRHSNSRFCPKCMDNTLISMCEEWLNGDFVSGE